MGKPRLIYGWFVLISNIAITPPGFSKTLDICEKWFQKEKIEQGENCKLKCGTARVGFFTMICPNFCDELCAPAQADTQDRFLFALADLYPGLSSQEKALASQEPLKMLKAYKLSHRAETLCSRVFPTSRTNDESDACRHFVWAALLANEFGREFAEKVLDAHEQEPLQPEIEKAMDLANNRRGISRFETLRKEGNFTDDTMLEAFRKELEEGNLIVLEPRKGGNKK